jgi:alanyl-tRNA synthetase
VLTAGLSRIEDLVDRTEAAGWKIISGAEVFRLYDSLGVPLDFVEDVAGQRGLTVDHAGFEAAMESQRERARASSAFETKKSAAFEFTSPAERSRVEQIPDRFEGYSATEVADAGVEALFDSRRTLVDALPAGAEGYAVLDHTPFYVESGGQVSDVGWLMANGQPLAEVVGMTRVAPGGARAHRIRTHLPVHRGARVAALVDAPTRDATRRNHTATHLLHAALRHALGTHVRQAGSLVAPDRLRFDFTHSAPLTDAQKRAIEREVNEQIYRNTPVDTQVRRTEDAIKDGAMALFGEKYGESVRVVSVPGFSTELCGGTHVRATGDIGPFLITEESGVAAGVRRIEAVTGAGAVERIQQQQAALDVTIHALGVPPASAAEAIARLQADAKRLARENDQLKMKLALGGGARGDEDDSIAVGDARLIARRVSGLEKEALRSLADSLRDRVKRGVVVLAAENDGKVQLLVSVTRDLIDRVKAGKLVKELAPIVGGAGGGRPDFAEAGGRDASRIDDLFARARELVSDALETHADDVR